MTERFLPTAAPPEQAARLVDDFTPTLLDVGEHNLCPECGEASFVNEEGCHKCYVCGFSSC